MRVFGAILVVAGLPYGPLLQQILNLGLAWEPIQAS